MSLVAAVASNVTLRCGDWRTVFRAFKPPPEGFILCLDPPYSERTHTGRRTGSEVRKSSIPYRAITKAECFRFVKFWARHAPQFWVIFGDQYTAAWWHEALEAHDQYVFSTVPWVKPNAVPRQVGDGPASATEHITIAAAEAPYPPVEFITIARWKKWPAQMFSRPGYYDDPTSSTREKNGEKGYVGAKPLSLMRKLVLHYSAPGQTVIDPFCGTGKTLVAALELGRNAEGCDIDPRACEIAKRDLSIAAAQTNMFPESVISLKPKQVDQWRAWNTEAQVKPSSAIVESTDTASPDE